MIIPKAKIHVTSITTSYMTISSYCETKQSYERRYIFCSDIENWTHETISLGLQYSTY